MEGQCCFMRHLLKTSFQKVWEADLHNLLDVLHVMVPLGELRPLHVVAVEAAVHGIVHAEELVSGRNSTRCDCRVDGTSLDLQRDVHRRNRVDTCSPHILWKAL